MEKTVEKKASEDTGFLSRFYSVVRKNCYSFMLALVVLVACIIFVVFPWLSEHYELFMKKGMFALSCVSSVILFFFVFPCLIYSSEGAEECACEDEEKLACEEGEDDVDKNTALNIPFFCGTGVMVFYVLFVLNGIMYLFANGDADKHLYAHIALLWFVLCLLGGIKIGKKLTTG